MFKNIQETIRALNADVKNVANCEKAKKLRKKLLSIGLPLAIGGFLGVFSCFILFVTAGSDAFGENGFTARIIVPFVLIIPCAIVGGFGMMIASLGFKIVITGYTADLIDETVGERCPSCGERVEAGLLFCTKCGAKVKKQCPVCQYINDSESVFCGKCGEKLS